MTVQYRAYTACYPIGKNPLPSYAMIIRAALFFYALLSTPLAFSAELSGIWKHAKAPAWIEIRLQEGVGIVVRNDKFPERAGREILKELKASQSQQGLWHGQMYIEKLAAYKSVEIALPEVDRMTVTGKVGFISRTVEWLRDDQSIQVKKNGSIK